MSMYVSRIDDSILLKCNTVNNIAILYFICKKNGFVFFVKDSLNGFCSGQPFPLMSLRFSGAPSLLEEFFFFLDTKRAP